MSSAQQLESAPPSDSTTTMPVMMRRPVLNEATRHLCVGAYVDQEYCAEVLRKVYFDGSRRIPPSYGFELPPVLVHARRAWLLDLGQHLTVAAAALGALVVDPTSVAAAITILISWSALRRVAGLGPAIGRYLAGRTHPEEDERIRARAVVFGLVLVGSWSALLLLFVLTRGAARIEELRATELWVRTGALAALWALIAIWFSSCRQRAVDHLRSGAREPIWGHNRRLANLDKDQKRPVTVYSGFRPFIGSGLELLTWSFAQLLTPKEEEALDEEALQFNTSDLVKHVKKHIRELAFDLDPERQLPNLTVRDHVFVTGTRADEVPEHPGRDDFVRIMSDTTTHTRHFLACQVPSWDGEVVTTVYVHVSLQGHTLYLEFSTWALPPTKADFHVVERVGGTGLRAHLRSVVTTLWTLPETLVHARRSLGILVQAVGAKIIRERWPLLQEQGIDVGAKVSVRELGADVKTDEVVGFKMNTDINYFQYRDVVKHSKVVERRLLATVQDFLCDHGIDTKDYAQRAITILNAGIVQTGGEMHFTGVVGEGTFNGGQTSGGDS